MDRNFLSGGVAELQEAKAALLERDQYKAELSAAMSDVSVKEKNLESQKKYVSDKITATVKDRRGQLSKSQDELIDKASRDVKEAEKRRKNAKTEAVNDRITNATSDNVNQIEQLKMSVKRLFREKKVPGICNTRYYYAMYSPKTAGDFFILVVSVLIAFGLIPNIVCAFLKDSALIVKVLVYLGIVVFFVLIYFLFYIITKRNVNGPVLEEARPIRAEIKANKKQKKQLTKMIEKDKDESSYGLEGYDSEIAGLQEVLNEAMRKKEEVLQNFDQNIAVEIRDEIQKENQPKIDQLTDELMASREVYAAAKTNAEAADTRLANTYELYLGEKNTTVQRIDEMIGYIQEGKAATIMEALDLQNGEIKQ